MLGQLPPHLRTRNTLESVGFIALHADMVWMYLQPSPYQIIHDLSPVRRETELIDLHEVRLHRWAAHLQHDSAHRPSKGFTSRHWSDG